MLFLLPRVLGTTSNFLFFHILFLIFSSNTSLRQLIVYGMAVHTSYMQKQEDLKIWAPGKLNWIWHRLEAILTSPGQNCGLKMVFLVKCLGVLVLDITWSFDVAWTKWAPVAVKIFYRLWMGSCNIHAETQGSQDLGHTCRNSRISF